MKRLFASLLVVAGCSDDAAPPVETPPSAPEDVVNRDYPNVYPTAPRPLANPVAAPWRSGRALAVRGDRLYALDADNQALVVVDREALEVLAALPLDATPVQLAAGPGGDVFVTAGDALVVVAPDLSLRRATVGAGAWAVALSEDAATVFVSLPRAVAVLDATTLEPRGSIPTNAAARALAVTRDSGGCAELAIVHDRAPAALVEVCDGVTGTAIDLALRVDAPAELTFTSRSVVRRLAGAFSAAIGPETQTLYIGHAAATPGDRTDLPASAAGLLVPGAPPIYYGAGVPGDTHGTPTRPIETLVSGFEGSVGLVVARPAVQDDETGEPIDHLLADARDVSHHPTWSMLFVSGFGSDNVVVFDTQHGDPMPSPFAVIRVGEGPSAVAFSEDGARAYVLDSLEHAVGEIDLAPIFDAPPTPAKIAEGRRDFDGARVVIDDPLAGEPQMRPLALAEGRRVTIGPETLDPELRLGRRLFHFARNPALSRRGHFSCASCHARGGGDGLVWVVGAKLRQTPLLAERLDGTAPFTWSGDMPHLGDSMRQTVGRMGGAGLADAEIAALEAYLLHGDLALPPNPHRLPGGLDSEQAWGKQIFEDPFVGCATCHAGSRFTDNLRHDVDTVSSAELDAWQLLGLEGDPRRLDTPSLVGLHASAPYLHDGSAISLEDVLHLAPGMGHTEHLSERERAALVAYLLTL